MSNALSAVAVDEEEEQRLDALARYGLAQDAPKPGSGLGDLDNFVRLATQLCGVPYGTVNIITADEQRQIAVHGIEPAVCSREDSMCARVLRPAQTVIVEDCRFDPRFAENPFVTGEIADLRFYASTPILSSDGYALGTLCVFDLVPGRLSEQQASGLRTLAAQIVDVLHLQLRTRELGAAMDELRRSNALLAEFAGRVSHDLRGPLGAILGMAELAAEEVSVAPDGVSADGLVTDGVSADGRMTNGVSADGAAGSYFARISASARRMTGMVEELLTYSRVDGMLNRRLVDLEELVAAVQQDLGPDVAAAGALIDVEPFNGEADPVQLTALLQNLVRNALAYPAPDRVPVIRISARGTAERWQLTVADNGCGIPAADRQRVVDPLVRLNRPGDPEGSGLGLSTCVRIAQAHGGRLELSESPGGGLTVRVSFTPAGGAPVS